MKFWGVYREREHSPEREFDDAEILRMTGARLAERGDQVTLFSPSELPFASGDTPDAIFVMCERQPILAQLQSWADFGVIVINSPSAISNTYRDRTLARLQSTSASCRSTEINFPESRIVETGNGAVPTDALPVWIKRGDVHCTQTGDVVLARSGKEIASVLAQLRGRGIETAVVQRHIPGDLIKFYGVGDTGNSDTQECWFRWFYHREQVLAGYTFDEINLMDSAHLAARALELEIFGGDAIVTASGEIWIIDVNAWPSFALYREEASEQIARLISARVTRAELVPVR